MPPHRLHNRRNIHKLHVGVGRCFEVDHPCFAGDRRFQGLGIVEIDMANFHPELTNTVVQKSEGTAIQGAPDNQLIARPQQGPDG
ncbi:hypothetical protein D3C72_1862850 [compost metagenome]